MRRWSGFVELVRAHGLLAGVAAWSRSAITRRRSVIVHIDPSALDVRPVSFHSDSGANIRAWFTAGRPGSGAVLLLHGVGADRRTMVARARFLSARGYSVLLPDFQAHGESGGTRVTFGALESLDVDAAVGFLRACCPGERVGMIGVSLGGAAALLGSLDHPAEAYVLESVFPTIRQALEGRLRVWLGPLGVLSRMIASPLMSAVGADIGVAEHALRPIDHIGRVGSPVFVIAGTRDAYTPLHESRALFKQAREPKTFWAVEGARHEDLHAYAGARYEQRVGDFLARHLRTISLERETR